MSKFLEKVLKFLTKFKFFRFESRKFLEFLLGLFSDEKGDIIEEIQGKCNNIVHTIEEFEDIAREKTNLTAAEILAEIEAVNPELQVEPEQVKNFEELLQEIQNVDQLRKLVLTQDDVIGGIVDYSKDLAKEQGLTLKDYLVLTDLKKLKV